MSAATACVCLGLLLVLASCGASPDDVERRGSGALVPPHACSELGADAGEKCLPAAPSEGTQRDEP
jgi:hypothetical protein